MKILAIETSCDETSAAHIDVDSSKIHIIKQSTSTSAELQKKYGGIVPEEAARKQVEYIMPVVEDVMGRKYKDKDIDAIAVTYGPGLAVSLQVGIDTAKTLSYIFQRPLIPVNHLEGHIYSPFIPEKGKGIYRDKIRFPSLALIVSGGHTLLVLVRDYLKYKVVGRTRDDAAGEAFDKGAKLLGLSYPGGPQISVLAEKGDEKAFDFPRGMIKSSDFDFSFSGLKTALLYTLQKINKQKIKGRLLYNLCASYQRAIVDALVIKTQRAAEKYTVKSVWIGGGVSANNLLRKEMERALDVPCYISPLKYTTDNAAMIGFAGYLRFQKGDWLSFKSRKFFNLSAKPNLSLIDNRK